MSERRKCPRTGLDLVQEQQALARHQRLILEDRQLLEQLPGVGLVEHGVQLALALEIDRDDGAEAHRFESCLAHETHQ